MDGIPDMDSHDSPVLVNLFMQMLLFKLGGQVTFNMEELPVLMQTYAGTRIASNTETGAVTLTLRSYEIENDRPPVPVSGDS